MKSLWNDTEAQAFSNDPLELRVYTSRLLGANPDLVLHGGGNTSVKLNQQNFFGDPEELLLVKGSGWDLATIESPGFAPVRLDTLKRLAELETLSDTEMVRQQRAAMTDPGAPNPSVEAILHALIPFRYVDHTHADAVLAVTNHPDGEISVQEIYGNRVIVIPYVMPGFVLAKKVRELTQGKNWADYEGMILMNHGIFTFDDDARESYEKMIRLVTEAEDYVRQKGARETSKAKVREDLVGLAGIRKKVSDTAGKAMLAVMDQTEDAGGFSSRKDISEIAVRGPLTPDHVLRTKNIPVMLDENPAEAIETFKNQYLDYFKRNTDGQLTCLDPAPRWAVWKEHGTLALPEKDLFEVEYWELEQAKLGKPGKSPNFQGKIALVSGAASGIGRACAETLHQQGAAVLGLDLNPEVEKIFNKPGLMGFCCDVTDDESIRQAVNLVVRNFGGLDVLVSNAGNFPAGLTLEKMTAETWDSSMRLNLSSHQRSKKMQ